jgi:polyisoprenoid-binding protein YceI
MKNLRILASVLVLTFFFHHTSLLAAGDPAKKAAAKAASLTVDPAKSVLTWTAKKVGGEHTGSVKVAQGNLVVKSNKLAGGTFTIDMTSITDTDITNEGMNAKLTGHLKSEDFFSVEKNPTSTFKITKAAPIANAKAGEANYKITGNLTIKGITNAITFPATVTLTGNSAQATAKIDVDRTKYDIKYRAAIIGTAADKIIDDNFTIDLKLVAGKSETASR